MTNEKIPDWKCLELLTKKLYRVNHSVSASPEIIVDAEDLTRHLHMLLGEIARTPWLEQMVILTATAIKRKSRDRLCCKIFSDEK